MKTTGSNSGALKKPRADGQLSGLAGELFVAAELLKRGLQTSITFGNAKAIDLLVHNPSIERTFTVHVKALRNPNFFLIGHKSVRSSLLSAFRAAVYFKHMPIIAVFFGIVVRMFYKEHEPAHFHAEHQGQQAKFDFSGNVVAGQIQSGTAVRLIREWAALHRAELEANWANMKAGRSLDKIPPLE